MSIPISDIKILWAKAAGRCSMPDCRSALTQESGNIATGGIVVGENCHIVAEKINGPRGNYQIPEENINRYPNLILLCSIHHKIVDTDVISWPIERLHQIKKDHENWVKINLEPSRNPDSLVYDRLVKVASEKLMLRHWEWISDHAIRQLANINFITGIREFNIEVNRAIFPGTKVELESSICELSNRAQQYADNYMNLAWLPNDKLEFYQEDKRWKSQWRNDYEQYANKSGEWQNRNLLLLRNMTHAINQFSNNVRKFVDHSFFLEKGLFCIHDSMGVTNGMDPCVIIPRSYI